MRRLVGLAVAGLLVANALPLASQRPGAPTAVKLEEPRPAPVFPVAIVPFSIPTELCRGGRQPVVTLAVHDAIAKPVETLLVADAMTGQDAVTLADSFHRQVELTGIVLTRVDGDARGGAALSMRAVTGQPIKLMGVGEKLDEMEPFQATRVAGRILGMGDVVGLVERAADVINQEDAEKLARKISKGEFSLEDMLDQFKQLRKMGDVKGLLGMLPGVGKIKQQLEGANIDNSMLARQEAIILSMTLAERRNPKILNGSRRRRIASGSGSTVQDVNRLLKQHRQMGTMMKKMGKMGRKGMMPGRGLPPELLSKMPPMKQGPFG